MMSITSLSRNRLKPSSVHQGGFTLLELLTVIFIIGIIISFASLSVGQNTSRTLQDEGERIYNLLRLASEEAVLEGHELAMELAPHSYRFLTLDGDEWKPIEDDRLLRAREMEDVIEVGLNLEGVEANLRDEDHPPRILVLSSGEMTPFELVLKIEDVQALEIRGDLNGKLNLQSLGQEDDV
jgi:general secretion pathway protein H